MSYPQQISGRQILANDYNSLVATLQGNQLKSGSLTLAPGNNLILQGGGITGALTLSGNLTGQNITAGITTLGPTTLTGSLSGLTATLGTTTISSGSNLNLQSGSITASSLNVSNMTGSNATLGSIVGLTDTPISILTTINQDNNAVFGSGNNTATSGSIKINLVKNHTLILGVVVTSGIGVSSITDTNPIHNTYNLAISNDNGSTASFLYIGNILNTNNNTFITVNINAASDIDIVAYTLSGSVTTGNTLSNIENGSTWSGSIVTHDSNNWVVGLLSGFTFTSSDIITGSIGNIRIQGQDPDQLCVAGLIDNKSSSPSLVTLMAGENGSSTAGSLLAIELRAALPANSILQSDPKIKFVDNFGVGHWLPTDPVIYDSGSTGLYASSDIVISGSTPAIGTLLSIDKNLLFYPINGSSTWIAPDPVIYDANADGEYDAAPTLYIPGNIVLSGSITPFAAASTYIIFNGSVAGYSGSYFAINGSNNIAFYGSDPVAVINNTISAAGRGDTIIVRCNFSTTPANPTIIFTGSIGGYYHYGIMTQTQNAPAILMNDPNSGYSDATNSGMKIYVRNLTGPIGSTGTSYTGFTGSSGIRIQNSMQHSYEIGQIIGFEYGILVDQTTLDPITSRAICNDNEFHVRSLVNNNYAVRFLGPPGGTPDNTGTGCQGNQWFLQIIEPSAGAYGIVKDGGLLHQYNQWFYLSMVSVGGASGFFVNNPGYTGSILSGGDYIHSLYWVQNSNNVIQPTDILIVQNSVVDQGNIYGSLMKVPKLGLSQKQIGLPFSAGSLTVTFPLTEQDINYSVIPSFSGSNVGSWWLTNKTTTGVRINWMSGSATGTLDYMVYR
jgi:hypothetical protein